MTEKRYVTYDEFQDFKQSDIREIKTDIRSLQLSVSDVCVDVGRLEGDMRAMDERLSGAIENNNTKIDALADRFDDFAKSITWYKYVFLVAVLAPVAERIFTHLF
ncbi:hypothetical protein WECO103172_10510 [Weissella confusa]|uniref:hypothetical protein n=1 Tax=Weissella confusa TaxID=1583 RepID=UPI0007049C25|nr:hypothetical protein [Weissella confusa]MBJ7699704.1 hypothetical protein [Weissella confusa]MBS7551857.1 hypothetical protein [Weissella confusa]MCQ8097704.1 hypothetical protein [Weissella confusa]MCQ8147111.1 hypothetical protein [Weissella confusa]TGE73893.1 hypothetical protein C6P09_04680 [Weissella confusa]